MKSNESQAAEPLFSKVFSFWRIVGCLSIARTGFWTNTNKSEKRFCLFNIDIVERYEQRALSVIILPISIVVGIVRFDKPREVGE